MSFRHPLKSMWWPEGESEEKYLIDSSGFSLQRSRGLLARASNLAIVVLPRICGQRKRNPPQKRTNDKNSAKMCIIVRADNGTQFYTVEMPQLRLDDNINQIIVSEELADRLLTERNLWRSIPLRSITDDQGLNHRCRHVIKVSWRWGNEERTADAKIYVSSQLKHTPQLNHCGEVARLHLLLPRTLGRVETGSATASVRPTYQLPRKTKDERERQKKNDEAVNKAHDEEMKQQQQKREKKFEDAYKKPAPKP